MNKVNRRPNVMQWRFRYRPIVPSMVKINAIIEHCEMMQQASHLKRKVRKAGNVYYMPITLENIRKNYRGRYHVLARTLIHHYLYECCDWTMKGIGNFFNRDHTTMVNNYINFRACVNADWPNDMKDHFRLLQDIFKRPCFPNYGIDDFYKKYNVNVNISPEWKRPVLRCV